MGADLFGSLAEATCAALVVSGSSKELMSTANGGAMYFPLVITAVGILVSFVTSFAATHLSTVTKDNVETIMKWQLIISTILMTLAVYPVTMLLPESFTFVGQSASSLTHTVTPMQAFTCVASGLWSGLIIGYVTEIYTSNSYSPV